MAEVLNNLFDPFFNKYIVEGLKATGGWRICTDEAYEDTDGKFGASEFSDTGHIMQTFSVSEPDVFNHRLNAYADLIFAKVRDASEVEYRGIKPIRYFWNYYSRSSGGLTHVDIPNSEKGNFASIVYYLNDSDGGTHVGKDFFENSESRAIIFDSRTNHRGVGPKIAKQRFVLNIIFQYSDVIEKVPNGKTNRILL